MIPNIIMIAAMTRERVIGKDGKIPWHIPEDLEHFKRTTAGHIVVMGRSTWDSLPKKFRPLPGRTNWVMTRKPGNIEGAHRTFRCYTDVLMEFDQARIQDPHKKLYVIGGAKIYTLFRDRAHALVLSIVHEDFEGDTFFPRFSHRFELQPLDLEQHVGEKFTIFNYVRKEPERELELTDALVSVGSYLQHTGRQLNEAIHLLARTPGHERFIMESELLLKRVDESSRRTSGRPVWSYGTSLRERLLEREGKYPGLPTLPAFLYEANFVVPGTEVAPGAKVISVDSLSDEDLASSYHREVQGVMTTFVQVPKTSDRGVITAEDAKKAKEFLYYKDMRGGNMVRLEPALPEGPPRGRTIDDIMVDEHQVFDPNLEAEVAATGPRVLTFEVELVRTRPDDQTHTHVMVDVPSPASQKDILVEASRVVLTAFPISDKQLPYEIKFLNVRYVGEKIDELHGAVPGPGREKLLELGRKILESGAGTTLPGRYHPPSDEPQSSDGDGKSEEA